MSSSVCGDTLTLSDIDDCLGFLSDDITLYRPTPEQMLLPDQVNCLSVEAFMKMCNVEYDIVERTNAAEMSPSGRLPWVKCKEYCIAGLQPLVEFLGNKGISLTRELNEIQVNDVEMYSSLVNSSLLNAEIHLTWADDATYSKFSSVRCGSVYPWPLSWMVPRRKRRLELKRLVAIGWEGDNAMSDVEYCLRALSSRLEGSKYFVADTPTHLDAMVFAHTLSILTFPQSHKWIRKVVQDYPVLLEHCCRVDKEFFESKYSDEINLFNS